MITLLWDKTTEPSPREKYLWCHAPGHDKEWCYWDGIRWIPAGSAPGLIDDDLLSDNIVRKSDLPELLPEYGAKQLYTWIKYADDAYGHGMSDKSEIDGVYKKYIGFAYNKETPEESNLPDDYEWSPISGRDGVGVNSTVYWYIASENNFGVIAPPLYINPETAGWSTKGSDFVLDETLKYLWSFVRVGYTDGDDWQSEPYIVKYFNEQAQITYDQVKDFVERKIVEDLDDSSSRLGEIDNITTKITQKDGLTEFLNSYCSEGQASFADFVADSSKALINQNVGAAIWGEGSQQTLTSVGQSIDGINSTLSTHATALFIDPERPEEGTWINDVRQEMDAKTGTLTQAVSKAEHCWEWTGVDKTISGKSVKTGEIFEYASTNNSCITKINDGESLANYEARISALGKIDPSDPEEKGFERKVISESLSTIKQTADNISLIVGNKDGQLTGIIINAVTGDPGTIELIADEVHIDGELIANAIQTDSINILDPETSMLLAHLGPNGLKAYNAEISGRITADSGEIGGFIIDSDNLKTNSGITFKNRSVTVEDKTYNVIVSDTVKQSEVFDFLLASGIISETPVNTKLERLARYYMRNGLGNTTRLIQWFSSSEDASGYTLENHDLVYDNVGGLSGKYGIINYGHGIATWFGGEKIDLAVTESDKAAKTLFRFDGSGYLASNSINWDPAGVLNINKGYLGGFEISEGRIGGAGTAEDPYLGLELTDEYLRFSQYKDIELPGIFYPITGAAKCTVTLQAGAGDGSCTLEAKNVFERTSSSFWDGSYASCIDVCCSGYAQNAAIMIRGGSIYGLKVATRLISNSNETLYGTSWSCFIIPDSNSNDVTLKLYDTYESGNIFFISKQNAHTLTINPYLTTVYYGPNTYTDAFVVANSDQRVGMLLIFTGPKTAYLQML